VKRTRSQVIIPSLLLGLLTLIFFRKIILSNLILVGVDVFLYFYPYKTYATQSLLAGRFPLWNPHLFMGVPFLANSQVGLLYPLNWLFLWADAPKQVAYSIGLHVWIAGVGATLFARRSLKLSAAAALAAGAVFAFSGFLGAQVEHINQLQVSAWLPWVFLLFDSSQLSAFSFQLSAVSSWRSVVSGRRSVALLGLVIALMLLAGHTQSVYISLFGLGVYGLFRRGIPWGGPKTIFRHLTAILLDFIPLALAIVLALLLSAAQLWPTAELAGQSIRSGGLDYYKTVAFSLNPLKLFYTLFPPYGIDLEAKLGQAFSEYVAYIGLIPLALAAWGAWQVLRRSWAARSRSAQTTQEATLAKELGLLITGATGLFLSFGIFTGPVYLALYWFAPGFDLFRVPARWLLLYTFSAAMLAAIGFEKIRHSSFVIRHLSFGPRYLSFVTLRGPSSLVIALILLELFIAAGALRYNKPTAPEAYASLRPAIAQLQAAQLPTDRFLSLSGIVYDPGDLQEIHNIFDEQLSPRAVYDYIITVKEKEVLFFNLPLVYGLNAVDGYDGGLLPLKKFIDLQRLFLPEDDLSLDGRLREKLHRVPENRLLSLLGVRHVVTDKVFDVWLDNIFYDLQFPAWLNPNTTPEAWTRDIPNFPATAIGLVYHTPKTAGLVAEMVARYASGLEKRFEIEAGAGQPWENAEFGLDYNLIFDGLPLDPADPIVALGVIAKNEVTVRGISLIHQPNTTSRSVLLTTEGDYKAIHDGDVKIYENQDALPRAFIAHQTEVVSDTQAAIARLKDPNFDVAAAVVRQAKEGEGLEAILLGQASPKDNVAITSYQAERIELSADLNSPGWLILTDAWYPGWQVEVNGATTEIQEVNLMFRAVELPAGNSSIIFSYAPKSFYAGIIISVIGLGILLMLLIFSPYKELSQKRLLAVGRRRSAVKRGRKPCQIAGVYGSEILTKEV